MRLALGRVTRLDAPHGGDAGGVGVGDKVVVRLPQGRAQVALQLAQWMRVGLTDVTICETYHK